MPAELGSHSRTTASQLKRLLLCKRRNFRFSAVHISRERAQCFLVTVVQDKK